MAQLIRINSARSDSEWHAQTFLAETLPASWIVTTNIYEANFPGRRKPEIDSIVMCPLGLFVLDFKDFRGQITPMINQAWTGLQRGVENPMEQAQNNIWPVKDLLNSHVPELGDKVWIYFLIVLTHKQCELDWSSTDMNVDAKLHVARLGEVESKIRQFDSATKMRRLLHIDLAREALEALKPPKAPEGVFRHDDWTRAAVMGAHSNSRRAASNVFAGNPEQSLTEAIRQAVLQILSKPHFQKLGGRIATLADLLNPEFDLQISALRYDRHSRTFASLAVPAREEINLQRAIIYNSAIARTQMDVEHVFRIPLLNAKINPIRIPLEEAVRTCHEVVFGAQPLRCRVEWIQPASHSTSRSIEKELVSLVSLAMKEYGRRFQGKLATLADLLNPDLDLRVPMRKYDPHTGEWTQQAVVVRGQINLKRAKLYNSAIANAPQDAYHVFRLPLAHPDVHPAKKPLEQAVSTCHEAVPGAKPIQCKIEWVKPDD